MKWLAERDGEKKRDRERDGERERENKSISIPNRIRINSSPRSVSVVNMIIGTIPISYDNCMTSPLTSDQIFWRADWVRKI